MKLQVSDVYYDERIEEMISAALGAVGLDEQEFFYDHDGYIRMLENDRDRWDYFDDESLKADASSKPFIRICLTDEKSEINEEIILKAIDKCNEIASDIFPEDYEKAYMKISEIDNPNWSEKWREFYKPIDIGERLRVVPAWEKNDDYKDGRIEIYIEPGQVFGTGEHQTTQLCLEKLENRVKSGMKVLDLGSGSGILAIATILLGAEFALAVEIEPSASNMIQENMELNKIKEDSIKVLIGDVIGSEDDRIKISSDGVFDLILVNIVADVIISLSSYIRNFMAKDSVLICSGIITQRLGEVIQSVEAVGLIVVSKKQKDDWWVVEFAEG